MAKMRSLFEDSPGVFPQPGDTYAEMLVTMLTKSAGVLRDLNPEQKLSLGTMAWNLSLLQDYLPEEVLLEMIPKNFRQPSITMILKELMSARKTLFPDTNVFIDDLQTESAEGRLSFSLEVRPFDSILEEMGLDEDLDDFEDEDFEDEDYEDEEYQRGFLDRNAVFVRYAQPFVDWLNKLGESEVSIEDFQEDGRIYLLETDGNPEEMLKEVWDEIFKMELFEWSTDSRRWPRKRSYAMFRQWFEVVMVEDVYDLVPLPISKFPEV